MGKKKPNFEKHIVLMTTFTLSCIHQNRANSKGTLEDQASAVAR